MLEIMISTMHKMSQSWQINGQFIAVGLKIGQLTYSLCFMIISQVTVTRDYLSTHRAVLLSNREIDQLDNMHI